MNYDGKVDVINMERAPESSTVATLIVNLLRNEVEKKSTDFCENLWPLKVAFSLFLFLFLRNKSD